MASNYSQSQQDQPQQNQLHPSTDGRSSGADHVVNAPRQPAIGGAASFSENHRYHEQATNMRPSNNDHSGDNQIGDHDIGDEEIQIDDGITTGMAPPTKTSQTIRDGAKKSNCNTILNDAYLIRSRRVSFSQKLKNDIELMSEDKISKNKLEEPHFSEPSSIQSTYIMLFSPDGLRVASTHGDHRIYICDLKTGKQLHVLEGHSKTVWCLAWHPKNKDILASGCLRGETRVWDLRTKACEFWANPDNTIISSLDFHPEERMLAVATSNEIHFWDWSESEPFAKTTTAHAKEKVRYVLFNPTGTKLITGISNLHKIGGYNVGSGHSLQHRLIDSYFTHLEHLTTENMTQSSDTSNSLFGSAPNSAAPSDDRNVAHSTPNIRQSFSSSHEQDLNYRSTLTLSRVAALYRHLESLEDSMRHTGFSPYTNPRPTINPSSDTSDSNVNIQEQQTSHTVDEGSSYQSTDEGKTRKQNISPPPPKQDAPSQAPAENSSKSNDLQPNTASEPSSSTQPIPSTATANNTFEQFVVFFDESLEHLQLSPLVVNGQAINLATIIEQYPVGLPYQVHHMMQFEGMNQVNQNFIRISKLMSSVRLYRQIVNQISSGPPNRGHFQPSQLLTVQSSSSRPSRSNQNLPIVMRQFPTSNPMEMGATARASNDPIMAIQFRHSARNVPLGTVCKIDLLAARCVCIMRSQQNVENTVMALGRYPSNRDLSRRYRAETSSQDGVSNDRSRTEQEQPTRLIDFDPNNISAGPPFYPLLYKLYQFLTAINHAPFTTSNVHSHITVLRGLINKLSSTLGSMFYPQNDGRTIVDMIHNIAQSLTGRSWDVPLGDTLDDIRLDVVYMFCIVDLTLHLTRQVQLLQLQRLSAVARIEESKRYPVGQCHTGNGEGGSNSNQSMQPERSQVVSDPGPSTSTERSSTSAKRLGSVSGPDSPNDTNNLKRRKVTQEINATTGPLNSDASMIGNNSNLSRQMAIDEEIHPFSNHLHHPVGSIVNIGSTAHVHAPMAEPMPSDRLLILNGIQSNPTMEQSLQRFLSAAASSSNNSHLLIRVYHRAQSNVHNIQGNEANMDAPVENNNLPQESRRRALSQDNPTELTIHMNATRQQQGQASNIPPVGPNVIGGSSHGIEAIVDGIPRPAILSIYQAGRSGHFTWYNQQWAIPLQSSNSNYRLQCWDYSSSAIPNIEESQANIVTSRCRIITDSSIDLSSDGTLIACLVPRDEPEMRLYIPILDLKVFSLKEHDFGTCYYKVQNGPNGVSVSLSPSCRYAVVGLTTHKIYHSNSNDEDLTIAKVYKLSEDKSTDGLIRDIKIKRDDYPLCLNIIRWMSRGIVYNVGPSLARHPNTRIRNRIA